MGKIGIIGAMEEEVVQLKGVSEIVETKNIAGMEFFVAKNQGKDIVIVRCGIGKVNAALCAQVMIDNFDVECVINVGVAGAIHKDVNICDIVVSTDTVQHDFDTTALGDPLGFISRMDESYFKADERLINIAVEAGKKATDHKVFTGRVASGDQFIATVEQKAKISSVFNAYCAEMEGAAIGHACYLNKVPFVVIRSISDNADNEAEMSFPEFVKIAANNSFKILQDILQSI